MTALRADTCLEQVVGIKYYRGLVSEGEAVTLQREPQNPYDGYVGSALRRPQRKLLNRRSLIPTATLSVP